MEIVTEPDFRSGEEAAAFVRELQLILVRLGTCDGKMEGKCAKYCLNILFFVFTYVIRTLCISKNIVHVAFSFCIQCICHEVL